MKKHTKFVAYALAGFIAVSAINVPSVYAEEIPTETVVDTTNNSATDTTTETPTDSTADSSTETPADSTADSSSTSTNKTTTVKKATATKKQTVKIKKYKKSKKLYVKKATKAYKVTSTGKLKAAKSLKKSAKVTVVGTAKVKKVKYYAIKSGKSTMLVKQSLLSKTKPKTAKPSSKPSTNSSSSNSNNSGSGNSSSTSKHTIPQNSTPRGYKGPANWYGKVDKYGNSTARDIKTVKVVDGKVEYRDIDGKIKYGKCKYWDDGYYYWYTMKDGRGFWMPIENTNLEYWDESDINGMWNEQNMDIKG